MIQSLKLRLKPLFLQLRDRFQNLSPRERGIIVLCAVILSGMLLHEIYVPIREAFAAQAVELTKAEQDSTSVVPSLERYWKLKARRDAIENEYKEVQFSEGALSHLENLVRTKAGIASEFTIKNNPVKEFGGNYEQTLFSIKFQSTNLPRLVDFMRELTHGERPMIVSRIDVHKSRYADRLEVEIDASSIRRLK